MMNFSIFLTKKASGSGINKRKAEWSDTVIFEATKVFGSFIQEDGSIKVGILLWNENSHSNVSFTSCSLLANVKRAQEHNGSDQEVLCEFAALCVPTIRFEQTHDQLIQKKTQNTSLLQKGAFQKEKVDFRK